MKASLLDMDTKQCDAASDSTYDVSDDESDDEGDVIPGTLDVPPPVGTQVKVLHDDDVWHLAVVLAARGSKARVRFEGGKVAVLDCEVHAVRLASYVGDDEDEDSDDDDDEEESIPGALDEAPPVGTLVKILFDDDLWYPAQVTAANGTKGTVVFSDNEEQLVDFDEHAVRLIDYVDDAEKSTEVDETKDVREQNVVATKCEAEEVAHVDQVTDLENSDLENTSESDIEQGAPRPIVITKPVLLAVLAGKSP